MIMWHPRLEWKVLYHVHFQPDCPFCPVWFGQGQSRKSLSRAIRKPTSHSWSACFLHIRKHCVQSIYKPMTGWSVKIRPPGTPSFILHSSNSVISLSLLLLLQPVPASAQEWPKPYLLVQICLSVLVFFPFNCGFWSPTGQHGLLEDHHCRCSCGCNYSVRL